MTYAVIFSKDDHKVEREVSGALEVGTLLCEEFRGYVWEFKDQEIEKQWEGLAKGETD